MKFKFKFNVFCCRAKDGFEPMRKNPQEEQKKERYAEEPIRIEKRNDV